MLERLGLADLVADPGRLVICRISGFGQSGPWSDRAGHDIGYAALAGIVARNRGVPAVQLGDLFGGAQTAVIAMLAALLERTRTGRGRVVDVAMTQAVTGLLLPHLGEVAVGVVGENTLDGSRPCYRVYACKDGGAYALGALEPKFWERFCTTVGRADWNERGFDVSLAPVVDALFATRAREEWDTLLRPADCCGEPVLTPSELRGHPVFAGLFAGDLPRTFPALVATPDLPLRAAPARGQHTLEVLREWAPRGDSNPPPA